MRRRSAGTWRTPALETRRERPTTTDAGGQEPAPHRDGRPRSRCSSAIYVGTSAQSPGCAGACLGTGVDRIGRAGCAARPSTSPTASAAAEMPTASMNAIVRRRRKAVTKPGRTGSRRRARSGSAGLRRVVLDLPAQPLNGDVNEPRVAEVVVVPDQLEQQFTREDLLGPARELEQQAKLGGGQRRRPPRPCAR